jgi:hypothetical protein
MRDQDAIRDVHSNRQSYPHLTRANATLCKMAKQDQKQANLRNERCHSKLGNTLPNVLRPAKTSKPHAVSDSGKVVVLNLHFGSARSMASASSSAVGVWSTADLNLSLAHSRLADVPARWISGGGSTVVESSGNVVEGIGAISVLLPDLAKVAAT